MAFNSVSFEPHQFTMHPEKPTKKPSPFFDIWLKRLLMLDALLIIIYLCDTSENIKVLTFCIFELVGASLLFLSEMKEAYDKDVHYYNETISERFAQFVREHNRANSRLKKGESLEGIEAELHAKEEKLRSDYPQVKRNIFLDAMYSICSNFISVILVSEAKRKPFLQLNGWPPKYPKLNVTRTPMVSAGYLLIVIAFALQLWYAIDMLSK